MGKKNSPNYVIQTRQLDEDMFRSTIPLGVGGAFVSEVRLVSGFGAVIPLAFSDQTFRVVIEQSFSSDGPFVETHRVASVINGAGTSQIVCLQVLPCANYMRMTVEHVGGTPMTRLQVSAQGQPVASGDVLPGTAGVVGNVVKLQDGATTVLESIKPDATALSATPNDGGALISGVDDTGPTQRHIRVDTMGRIIISPTSGGTDITGNTQIQTIETTTPLGAAATFNGTEHDNIEHEGFGISVTLIGGGSDTEVDINFQQRFSGAGTFRIAFTIRVPVAAGETVDFDTVLSVTRQFGRLQLINTTANALATTEGVVMRKPIA